MMKRVRFIVFLVLINLTVPVLAQTLPSDVLRTKTLERLQAFDQNWNGALGVAALDLTTGDLLTLNADVVFPQASVIKIPLLVEVFRHVDAGKLDLDEIMEIDDSFRVGGSGRFQNEFEDGVSLRKSLREVVEAMMRWSDNVATNVLIDRVGMASVNRTMVRAGLGEIRLQRVMMDAEAVAQHEENLATPWSMVGLLRLLYENPQDSIGGEPLLSPAARDSVLAIMSRVEAEVRRVVPVEVPVASKPGGVSGSRSESALVLLEGRPFVLSVMSAFNQPSDASPVAEIAGIVFDYFERLAHANRYGHRTRNPFE